LTPGTPDKDGDHRHPGSGIDDGHSRGGIDNLLSNVSELLSDF
jgi:hypothetical protein